MTENSKHAAHELHEYLRDQAHWKTIAIWILIGLGIMALVVWFGRDVIDEIEIVEEWIVGHGFLGWLVFVFMLLVLTSVFVPLSPMAIAAGAMFGLVGGTLLVFFGTVLTAAFNYAAANGMLKTRIKHMLERHPKLQAIQQAVDREGVRLQLLLRMAPISAVTVSYVLGATGVRFSTFLIATLGLIPSVIMNVYVGYTASHVTKVAGRASDHSTMHTVVTVVGLVVCVLVMIAITRTATKAIANADKKPE